MRHRTKGSRLNRKSAPLKALLRNLVTSLVLNEKMITTESKAKALVPVFDRLVKKVRTNNAANAIREIKKVLFTEEAQRKFLSEIVPHLEGKQSGFTRQTKIGFRDGDNAPMVQIQIITPSTEFKNTTETPVSENTQKPEISEETK